MSTRFLHALVRGSRAYCSLIGMSQLEMLSFLLTQLSTVISTLVSGSGRC